MKIRVFCLALLFVLVGVAVNVRGAAISEVHSQRWLEDHTVVDAGPYHTVPGVEGTRETYHMDPTLVSSLHAAGLVSRTMTDGAHSFDAVVISSDRGESFHDPAGCFQAQGWNPKDQSVQTVHTASRGDVAVQFLTITGPDGVDHPAAYCFRVGKAICPTQTELIGKMMLSQIESGRAKEGYMYRFIDNDTLAARADLGKFVAEYMGSAINQD